MADPAQVVIRIVPRGGTKTIQQVINQWEYLSRKGKLELRLSARHLDIPLPPDQITRFARSWVLETGNYDESLPDEQRQQDLTTHIIVSFPQVRILRRLMQQAANGRPTCLGQAMVAAATTILQAFIQIAIIRICMSWSTDGSFLGGNG